MKARHVAARTLQAVLVGMVTWARIGGAARAAEQSKSTLAFEQLASLVGEWKGVQDGTEIQVTYALTADGSALMEEFRPKNGPMMVTISSPLTTAARRTNHKWRRTLSLIHRRISLAFSLVRVTGLRSLGDWPNTGLVVTMDDQDHLTQEWV